MIEDAKDGEEETVTLNVGGVRHETKLSTLRRMSKSTLANDKVLRKHYRPQTQDYFFDRHPGNASSRPLQTH